MDHSIHYPLAALCSPPRWMTIFNIYITNKETVLIVDFPSSWMSLTSLLPTLDHSAPIIHTGYVAVSFVEEPIRSIHSMQTAMLSGPRGRTAFSVRRKAGGSIKSRGNQQCDEEESTGKYCSMR